MITKKDIIKEIEAIEKENISKRLIRDDVKKGFLYASEMKRLFIFEYNPPRYEESESIDYQIIQIPGRQYPIVIYNSGRERTISFQLLTTGYRLKENTEERKRTIEQWLDEFYSLMRPQGLYLRPPICYFGWGNYIEKCVILSARVSRELFDEELNTKRLLLDVELLLIESEEQKVEVKGAKG